MHKRTCCVEALLINPAVTLADISNMLQAEWLEANVAMVTVDSDEEYVEVTEYETVRAGV